MLNAMVMLTQSEESPRVSQQGVFLIYWVNCLMFLKLFLFLSPRMYQNAYLVNLFSKQSGITSDWSH